MQISQTAAIITGGASGLGEATARRFRNAGAQVTIFDLDDVRGPEVANEIGAGFAKVNVTDPDSVSAGISAAVDEMGLINACVNCAGIASGEKTVGRDGPHALDSFQRTIDINLIGTFNVLRLAAAQMSGNAPNEDDERGVIINTASIAAFDGQMGQVSYAASKAGIAGMSLPVARDLARNGIRIMAIAPGIFLTPMLEGLGQEIIDGLAVDVTFPKRLGKPAEFASLVQFIVENGYLNGEVIRIDGALRMR